MQSYFAKMKWIFLFICLCHLALGEVDKDIASIAATLTGTTSEAVTPPQTAMETGTETEAVTTPQTAMETGTMECLYLPNQYIQYLGADLMHASISY